MNANGRYESSFKQMEKFYEDWNQLKTELLQVGSIYDDSVDVNLQQCRLNCEHFIKEFVFNQFKVVAEKKKVEMVTLRRALRKILRADTKQAEKSREKVRDRQYKDYEKRELKRRELLSKDPRAYGDQVEIQLDRLGLKRVDPEKEVKPEEEVVMSYLLRQVEMEDSLGNDYESIVTATKKSSIDVQNDIKRFNDSEKQSVIEEGSWFNKHRDTIERHTNALMVTLQRVRNKVAEGYRVLNSKIEALDFDVERAAEEELAELNMAPPATLIGDNDSVSQLSQDSMYGSQRTYNQYGFGSFAGNRIYDMDDV